MTGRTFRRRVALAAVGLLAVAGCAREPAFQATLPPAIEHTGKAIAVIGDLQQTPGFIRFVRRREDTSADQQRLIEDLAEHRDELAALVIVGDLVYTARSGRDWRHFDSLVAPFAASVPVLPAIGNHDYPCILVQFCFQSRISKGMLRRFPWLSPGRPYTVDSGALQLVFIDSETGLEAQGLWLRERLAALDDSVRVVLVFYHRPAYTNTIDWGAKPDPDVQQHIVPALGGAPVPVVVFNGHVHGYEYILRDGVHHVTTAGGGGPRGPLADERPGDGYRGRDCPQPDASLFRPFNYALVREQAGELNIEIRGFCRGDTDVVTLDTIEIPI